MTPHPPVRKSVRAVSARRNPQSCRLNTRRALGKGAVQPPILPIAHQTSIGQGRAASETA